MKLRLIPASLFGRALLTLVVTFGLFGLVTFSVIVSYALTPVAQRSASDLASIMVLSARTLRQLPAEMRDDYRSRLAREYQIRLAEERPLTDVNHFFFPYLGQVKRALEGRLGGEVEIVTSVADNDRWFWVALDSGGETLWAGFPRSRVETRPIQGLSVIIGVAVLMIFGSAVILAGRVTQPLNHLSKAAEQVALGYSPAVLSESGPKELANLARQFNTTSRRIRELIANRTLLLAGISHDLRTPLTRLRLAVEMLPRGTAPALVARMERDIEEMNALITQAIDFGKSLGAGPREDVDLAALIDDLVSGRPRVIWEQGQPCRCRVDVMALRRILVNLLENALRYSRDLVEIHLDCKTATPVIFVLDRGPGIPEAEREAVFRPYYRLETSRSRLTGGTGLGLAVAYQLALANQMELHLGARRGGGTAASVRLPPFEMEPDLRPRNGMAVDDPPEGA
ncbi:MAG: HAMP domain-containing protein [Gammaproteobacteria bacterium]|nr:HAMP domain-containing protein [Gammaproteobacteria bacterium]